MRRTFLYIAAAIISATALISCSDDNDGDNGIKSTYEFTAPCLQWHCTQDQVKSYMGSLKGWSEFDDEQDNTLAFEDKKTGAQMIYEFGSEGLKASELEFWNISNELPKLQEDVTKLCNVNNWREYPETAGVKWFSGSSSDKHCNVSIGYGTSYGGYLYADFEYSEFIF